MSLWRGVFRCLQSHGDGIGTGTYDESEKGDERLCAVGHVPQDYVAVSHRTHRNRDALVERRKDLVGRGVVPDGSAAAGEA